MNAFTTVLPKGTLLYRGSKNAEPLRPDTFPMWFCEQTHNASYYGEHVASYVLTRDVRLLNAQHQGFHQDFINRLNITFPGDNGMGMDDRKLAVMAALGLPDLATQRRVLGEHGTVTRKNVIDTFVGCFGGAHRYSSSRYDNNMVSAMTAEYAHMGYDGYISACGWPSYYMDGFLTPEICMFVPQDAVVIEQPTVGGGGARGSGRSRGADGRFKRAQVVGGSLGVVQVLGRSVDVDSLVRLGGGCKANMEDPRSFSATLPGLADVYPHIRHLCAPEPNSYRFE